MITVHYKTAQTQTWIDHISLTSSSSPSLTFPSPHLSLSTPLKASTHCSSDDCRTTSGTQLMGGACLSASCLTGLVQTSHTLLTQTTSTQTTSRVKLQSCRSIVGSTRYPAKCLHCTALQPCCVLTSTAGARGHT